MNSKTYTYLNLNNLNFSTEFTQYHSHVPILDINMKSHVPILDINMKNEVQINLNSNGQTYQNNRQRSLNKFEFKKKYSI